MILAFLILLCLDRYFGVFGSDLQASPPAPHVYLTVELKITLGSQNFIKRNVYGSHTIQLNSC